VSFDDADEEAIVSNYATGLYWIGLNDQSDEGTFVWTDGTVFGSYTNWGEDQPGTKWWQDCVFVQQSGDRKWVATYSEWAKPYVCEAYLSNLCSDAKNDCEDVLVDFPDACTRSMFANVFCRRTCSLCPPGSIDIPKPSTTETPSCREGYHYFEGSCYGVVTLEKNFKDAERFCRGSGSFLTSITSQEEFDFITSVLPDYVDNLAIGLSDRAQKGTFVYIENGEEASFVAWGNNQPKTKDNFDCVHLRSDDNTYKTQRCRVQASFICEYHLQNDVRYVGALPVDKSSSDFSVREHLYIPRPSELLPAGSLVGFHLYAARTGSVVLLILRPTNKVQGVIDQASVIYKTELNVEQPNTVIYEELDVEAQVEAGDVIGFYFPVKNPLSFREGKCEHGPVLGRSDLQDHVVVADEGICRDYFVQAEIRTEQGGKRQISQLLATLHELAKELEG